jgi:hypothetical protein
MSHQIIALATQAAADQPEHQLHRGIIVTTQDF